MTDTTTAPLTGSDKQIEWADEIRRPVIAAAADYLEQITERFNAAEKTEKRVARHEKTVAGLLSFSRVDDAAWWIDQRHAIASRGAECYVQITEANQFHCPTCGANYWSTRSSKTMKCAANGCAAEWAVRI